MENKTLSHNTSDTNKFWLRLDNAAKIFPAVMTKEMSTVFRLTAILNETVSISALMKAVSRVEKRFPYFLVRLKEGFFWYYLEYYPSPIPIEPDDKQPCRFFPNDGLLIRILVKDKNISVEFAHILTDGGGAFYFFKTLLSFYKEELENTDTVNHMPLTEYTISEEEYEDSYKRYFQQDIPPMVSQSAAFHLPFSLNNRPRFHSSQYMISLKQIKAAADHKNVSITDYVVATYMCSLQAIYENRKSKGKKTRNKKIRIQVPVNLRNIFPSNSMRNFSLFVMPEIDLRLGHYTFDEILKVVHHQIRLETDQKLINKNISRNVGSEKKIYVKSIPLFLKSLILRLNYYTKGTNQYSGVVTNLGKAKLPEETSSLINYFIFTPPPPNKILKVSCGIIGFGDKLVLSFGNITKSMLLEDTFLNLLKSNGIPVNQLNNSTEENL
ncbi:MAG: hypothetical protein K9I29_00555 [Bacteroidales bacterium]|nr:hypothetical protein [Bacteroidales bacterium]MCF8326756.1 hypothetical protein [Bacteroidales bacterium]